MTQTHKVYLKKTFTCDAETLFQWLTRPELIVQWFGPKHLKARQIKADLKVGGHFSIEVESAKQEVMWFRGEYQMIDRPTLLVFTFNYEGIPSPPPPSVVSFNIESEFDRSVLTFVQEFETLPADLPKRTEAWDNMFDLLEQLFVSGS